MLDPKRLRAELELVAEQLARRGYQLDIEKMKSLEEQRKALQIEQQELQNERNTKSKSIGKAKAAGEDVQPLLDEVAGLGDKLKAVSEKSDAIQTELHALMMSMPNTPHDSVPDGKDEEDNREERIWGEIPTFDFEPKDHV
ncbi:MAG: serine--tRNA ligase, partial [Sedimenticolaceae bacterium]